MTDERTPNDDPTEPLRPVRGADERDAGTGDGAQGGAGGGEAPTERYDAIDAGDAPTRAFTQPLDRPAAAPPTAPTEALRPAAAAGLPCTSTPIGGGAAVVPASAGAATGSRRLSGGAIALIALAGILLLALVGAVLALLNRDDAPAPVASGTPSASASPSEPPSPSPTPSETEDPTPSPTETATETAPAPTFTIFQAENTANCPDDTGSVPLFWSWKIDGAAKAWFGIGTDDARANPYEEVPTTATYQFAYQCSEESQLYTVSAENADGLAAHQTVEVVRLLP